ncbi:MAG: Hsp20/alpha crystallin family protein [Gemmataceae bacterium]
MENTVTTASGAQVAEQTRNNRYYTPRVDILETDGELLLYAEMPGVRPNDIDLRYEQGELILQGKTTRRPHAGALLFNENEAGDYYRVFQIHETIDASRIEAEAKNGVLLVHLPKAQEAKPRQVAVKG